MDNRPIGFFDSGLGGLTAIPHLFERLPNERVIYFGDTARTPYGSKAVSTIRNYVDQIGDFLVSKDVKMLVIACNTVSSTCLERLSEKFPGLPVVGIIRPAAARVAEICGEKSKVGVIATKVTVNSGAYGREIRRLMPGKTVYEKATPAFVPLIEEGIIENEIMDLTIHYYMDEFIAGHGIDVLVLGCTHYPLIRRNVERIYPGLTIVNPSLEIIGEVETILRERDALAGKDNERENVFYASDLSENFTAMIEKIMETERSNLILKFKNLEL